jgi:hypothetical protein
MFTFSHWTIIIHELLYLFIKVLDHFTLRSHAFLPSVLPQLHQQQRTLRVQRAALPSGVIWHKYGRVIHCLRFCQSFINIATSSMGYAGFLQQLLPQSLLHLVHQAALELVQITFGNALLLQVRAGGQHHMQIVWHLEVVIKCIM